MYNKSFCETLLSRAFPFHFVVDDSGSLTSWGKSLEKVIPSDDLQNTKFFSHFQVQHPLGLTGTEHMRNMQDKLVLLLSNANSDLMFRGQIISMDDSDDHVFLVSPWITDLTNVNHLGLTLEDFALHNPLLDFLILVQAQRSSLNDSQQLSEELSKLNTELEDRVERRTKALNENTQKLLESKKSLEQEMKEKQRMEIELRHAQKLEAIGQLSAGIAHEINTPMQYIGNSLQFLQFAFSDLQELSYHLEDCLPLIDGHEKRVASISEAIEATDLEYVRDRAPRAIERALQGIDRVTQIVGALNEFSHPDRRSKSSADLNRALESTLKIASNEYKYVAQVDKQYGDLQNVDCHLGDLNQVFLNLIVNAAHAIAERSEANGLITIKTWQEENKVHISVADNGSGIPEKIQHRIFDPFFTTKEVGRGTGQGLSISHKIIVENHGGQLTFTTEPGVGTTFFIVLPVKAPRVNESNDNHIDDGELAA